MASRVVVAAQRERLGYHCTSTASPLDERRKKQQHTGTPPNGFLAYEPRLQFGRRRRTQRSLTPQVSKPMSWNCQETQERRKLAASISVSAEKVLSSRRRTRSSTRPRAGERAASSERLKTSQRRPSAPMKVSSLTSRCKHEGVCYIPVRRLLFFLLVLLHLFTLIGASPWSPT